MNLNVVTSISQQRIGKRLSRERFTEFLWMFILIGGSLAIIIGGSWIIGSTNKGMWVVAGLAAAIIAMGIVNRPSLGLYILVVFVYLNLSDILEVAFGIPSINKLLVALTAVSVFGSHIILQNKPVVFGRIEFVVAAYAFVVTLSTLGGQESTNVIGEMVDVAKDFVILLIIVQVADNERSWKRMQWMLIFAAAFLSLLTTYQMLTGNFQQDFFGLAKAPVHQIVGSFDSTRPTGPLEDPNYYAQILLMIMPFAIYRVIGETKRLNRGVAIGCLMLMAATILFTYSRTAFMVMLFVGFLIAYERRYNLYKLGGLLVVAFVLALPILPPGYTDRILTLTQITGGSSTMQTERSFRGRSSEMIIAVQMFLDRPVLGVGYGSYQPHYLEYSMRLGMDDRLESREAHSLYLEVAAETGILGIVSFTGMIGTIFWMMRRARRQLQQIDRADLLPWITGLQYGLMSYLITSIFLHDDYVRYLRLSIALVAGGIALVESLVHQQALEHQDNIVA